MPHLPLRIGVALALALATALANVPGAQLAPLANAWHQVLPPATQTVHDVRFEHVDSDGRLDLLSWRSVNLVPEWHAARSKASGGFEAPIFLSHGEPVGDLDLDGRVDFVRVLATSVTPPLSTTFEVQLSNGDGTYATLAPQLLEFSVFTTSAALRGADLDNDGVLDVFAYGKFVPQILTSHGDGSGGLSNLIGFAYGAQSAIDVEAADLEGDGDTDLVVCTDNPDTIAVLESVGPAWFLAPVVEDAGLNSPEDLSLGDCDLDGDLDAAYRLVPTFNLRYLEGDGLGGFAPAVDPGAAPTGIFELIITDADEDGDADIVVDQYWKLGVYPGSPGALPGAYQVLREWPASDMVRRADVDADGQREWIAGQGTGVAVIEDAGPNAHLVLGVPPADVILANCTADFDGDGRSDLALSAAVSPQFSAQIQAYLWNGTSFAQSDVQVASTLPWLATADFDRDGRADLCSGAALSAQLYGGNGDGTFQSASSTAMSATALRVRVGDANGDGNADLVCLTSVGTFAQQGLQAVLGDGAGGLVGGPAVAPATSPLDPYIDVADVDLDGDIDVLSSAAGSKSAFTLARGDGLGGFLPPQVHESVAASHVIRHGRLFDLDEDGRADAILSVSALGPVQAGILARLASATHGFQPTVALLPGVADGKVAFADLDRDGAAELLADAGPSLAVAKGAGTSWTVVGSASTTGSLRAFDVVELDGNGSADVLAWSVVSATPNYDFVSLLPNVLAQPVGLVSYGSGTPNCLGTITGVANLAPKVGESQFKLSWTNAPANAQALVGIAFAPDPAGTDVFGVGVKIHIGLLGPVLAYNVASDASGAASLAFPVPNIPELAGFKAYAQALWIEPAWQSCSSSPLPWSSSTGLEVTVLQSP
ncbi:MAG: VCBS repeat-containing protein [Planctomycetota bacterium]|nr:MAG: VCBS repeat-containing protein [Planctomycetota bacterium]